jgi:hypothetical protein
MANKALLVGINAYKNKPLKGCVNDVTDMGKFLVEHYGFKESELKFVLDSDATCDNIKTGLKWLVSDNQPGDRLVFHYSGHGSQVPTFDLRNEPDGMDEIICPVDQNWRSSSYIRDKDFNKIFSTIPPDVYFVWLSDSCHSGDLTRRKLTFIERFKSMVRGYSSTKFMLPPLDLRWAINTIKRMHGNALDFVKTATGSKGLPLPLAATVTPINGILVSGCAFDQSSSDTFFDGKPNGVLTYYFLRLLKHEANRKLPLATLVAMLREDLKRGGFGQIPQLEGSVIVANKPFMG